MGPSKASTTTALRVVRRPDCRRSLTIRRSASTSPTRSSTPRTGRPGAMRRPSGSCSASRCGTAGSITRSRINCRSGRCRLRPARSARMRASRSMSRRATATPRCRKSCSTIRDAWCAPSVRCRSAITASRRSPRRQLRNGNGGVAIGYDYTPNGLIDRSKCGGYLWSTGEELRVSHDPALAAQLAAGGPVDVNGLQGNGIELVRPQNVPPLRTYFIDYDDMYDDAASRGHMGDVAIYRVCGPRVGIPGLPAIGIPLLPPPLLCVPGTTQQPGYQCCPDGTSMNASGQCVSWYPPGIDPNGSTSGIPNRQLCAQFDPTTVDSNNPQNLRCIGGAKPIATGGGGTYGCLDYSLAYNPPVCALGYTKGTVGQGGVPGLPPTGNPVLDNEQVCVPNQRQQNCATGQQVGFDGQCHVLCPNGGTAYPLT